MVLLEGRNEKIFDNVDKDPLEVLHFAGKETQLWMSAQLELQIENHGNQNIETQIQVWDIARDINNSGYCCYVDGSWQKKKIRNMMALYINK